MKLIDKGALVAEIEKLQLCTMDEHMNYYSAEAQGEYNALSKLESFLDTLEVKEVDLEKEYKDFVEEDPVYNKLVNGIVGKAIAKHFFELGMSVSNILCNLDTYIDSMQEEHVKRTPADVESAMQEVEEKSKAFTEAHKEESADEILAQMRGEEPVIEELEEASKAWLRPQLDKSYVNYGEAKMMELTHFDGYAMLDAIEFGAKWQKAKDESTTEDLEDYINELSKQFPEVSFAKLSRIAVRVAKWQKEKLWKPADGDNLPEIDREVIALLDNGKVVFAHRPPEYWDGKNIDTGKVTRNYPKTYDKGGWNIPGVKFWLDVKLPKEIEL